MVDENALVQLLKSLVAIDSTSTRSNLPMVEALEARLRELGLKTTRQSYVDSAGVPKSNLIAQTGAGVAELALVGHTDCVPFDEGWSEALLLTEREGNLFGRGSCDTKSFISASVAALANVKSRLTKNVALIFTAGAKKLSDAKLVDVRQAVIGEPTSLTPVRANKGYCLAEIEIGGKEGHSAYPDTGASAIFRAARLLTALEAYSKGALRQQLREDFFPAFTTLNVGVIQGGKAKNVIAGHCLVTLEWRPIPGQPPERVLDDVKQMIRQCQAEDSDFVAEVKVLRMDSGFDTAPNAAVVERLAEYSGRAPVTVAFGTEGPQLAAMGCVPVVFGPGDIRVAHQTGEYVPVVELHRARQILEQMLLRFAA
jgi:acetylornithine deacetylase